MELSTAVITLAGAGAMFVSLSYTKDKSWDRAAYFMVIAGIIWSL